MISLELQAKKARLKRQLAELELNLNDLETELDRIEILISMNPTIVNLFIQIIICTALSNSKYSNLRLNDHGSKKSCSLVGPDLGWPDLAVRPLKVRGPKGLKLTESRKETNHK